MAANPIKYINQVKGVAITEGIISGVPPSIKIAQSIIESGYGQHAPGNAYFGVKSSGGWTGPSTNQATTEYFGGYVGINSNFRAYESLDQSFIDHTKFLEQNGRYDGLFHLDFLDYQGWAHGLKAAGYATDPGYADKLINVIEQYDLDKYDRRAKMEKELFYGIVILLLLFLLIKLFK